MTFWQTVERGEYIMIVLAVLLILTICIWWVRSVKLSKEKKSYQNLMHRVRDHVVEGDIENARQLCEASDSKGSNVLCIGLGMIGKPMTDLTSAMQDTSAMEKESMSVGLEWLQAIAVMSPLLGFGGTLVGIIDRLRDLGDEGAIVDLSMLCGEIAPTIVTTVTGLGVGIFAIIAYTCLSASIDSSKRNLSQLALEFTKLLNEPS